MGDEITLSVPGGSWGNQLFQQWMKIKGYPAVGNYNATICYDPKDCNPKVFYYSNLYRDAFGLSVVAPATKKITAALKNAGVGANYSPLDYNPTGRCTIYLRFILLNLPESTACACSLSLFHSSSLSIILYNI